MIQLPQFPLSGGQQVGRSYDSPGGGLLEPSGLVALNNMLYMASDNGYLMSVDLTDSTPLHEQTWQKVHNFTNDAGYKDNRASYDLESVTVAKEKLMIGVEGGKTSKSCCDPHILRYDTVTNNLTNSIWELSHPKLSGGGMEAMTFVPSWACPNFGGTADYGGYFFAAFQSRPGYIYVYDLVKGNNKKHSVHDWLCRFPIDVKMQASDMCFADGYLFVLFDGGGSKDQLHLFQIAPHCQCGKGADEPGALIDVVSSPLPVLPGWSKQTDFEAVAVNGSNLYLGVDGSTKLVWAFSDFKISLFGV